MSAENSFTLRIDRASEGHLADIAALAGIVWRVHYPGIISSEQIDYMLARMYDLTVLRDELTSGIHFERALMNGTLHGFSSFGPGPTTAEVKLHKLYVHPDWQRRGIGRALLDSCATQARRSGAKALVLNVNKRNERTIAAYRNLGFTIRESIVVEIGGGFVMDDFLMAKRL